MASLPMFVRVGCCALPSLLRNSRCKLSVVRRRPKDAEDNAVFRDGDDETREIKHGRWDDRALVVELLSTRTIRGRINLNMLSIWRWGSIPRRSGGWRRLGHPLNC